MKNCRLKKVHFKNDGDYIHGFILIAKAKMMEFYSLKRNDDGKAEANEWI